MAIPTVKNTATTHAASGTTQTVNLPASIVAGELLVMVVATGSDTGVSTPSGWREVFDVSWVTGSMTSACFVRTADGSEGATVSVTVNSSTPSSFIVVSIEGAQDDSVEPVVGGYQEGDNTNTFCTCPSVAAAADDSLVLRLMYARGSTTITEPTGTAIVINGTASSSSSPRPYVRRQTAAQPAGATGTVNYTGLTDYRYKSGATVSIAPSSGGASAIHAFIHHRRLLGVQ